MFRTRSRLAPLVPLAAALACSAPARDPLVIAWRPLEPGAPHQVPPAPVDPAAAAEEPALELPELAGAEDYVRLALARSPALRAAAQRVERLAARVDQVSLDDPMLTVAPIGEMAETAAGQVDVMAGVSQRFPFPGKLDARARIAEQEAAVALRDLEAARLAVAADARRAYATYYYTTRALEVVEQDRALLRRLAGSAESELAAGSATQQDVLRASVELAELENELVTLGQRRASAGGLLNSLLDRPVTAELPPPRPIEPEEFDLRLEDLLERAAEVNPSLARIREQIQGSRERLELARLERWPDVDASLNYGWVDDGGLAPSADGTDQWWIGLGLNLPVQLGRRRAAEREARHGIAEGYAELADAHNRVAFRVQDAALRLEAQQRLVRLFRDTILPQARLTVAASESGYRAGTLDFLGLLENRRKLLEFELMLHRTLAQVEQDLADLQELVGSDPERAWR